MTGTLSFNAIRFYGFHGMYEEESKTGTWFTIHVSAVLKTDFAHEDPSMINSVNYEDLFSTLQEAFARREDLMETVASNIYNALKKKFKQVEKWKVQIEKQNPLGAGNFNPGFCLEDE